MVSVEGFNNTPCGPVIVAGERAPGLDDAPVEFARKRPSSAPPNLPSPTRSPSRHRSPGPGCQGEARPRGLCAAVLGLPKLSPKSLRIPVASAGSIGVARSQSGTRNPHLHPSEPISGFGRRESEPLQGSSCAGPLRGTAKRPGTGLSTEQMHTATCFLSPERDPSWPRSG